MALDIYFGTFVLPFPEGGERGISLPLRLQIPLSPLTKGVKPVLRYLWSIGYRKVRASVLACEASLIAALYCLTLD
jgi:hypothetical protein